VYSCEAVYIHVAHHPLEGLVVCVVGLDAWAELERPELPVAGVVRDSVTSGVGCSPLPWLFRPKWPGMGGGRADGAERYFSYPFGRPGKAIGEPWGPAPRGGW
jgi:hypothetical protein